MLARVGLPVTTPVDARRACACVIRRFESARALNKAPDADAPKRRRVPVCHR